MFVDNHHEDGRLAIWCNAPPGTQDALVASHPKHYFVPPYVGPQGWIGVRLDTGLKWATIGGRIKEAHRIATSRDQARPRAKAARRQNDPRPARASPHTFRDGA
jgi:hypothetical protein